MTSSPGEGPRGRAATAVVAAIVALQVVCGLFFVQDLVVTVLGLRRTPVSWTWVEILQIMATVGLLLGMVLGLVLIRNLIRQRRRDAERLRAATGAFFEFVQRQFDEWSLTASERDVAMFILKGMSNQEIAALRATSEGTIKSQCTAIFRKAGVGSRAQLTSTFIEEILSGPAESAASPRTDSAGPAAEKTS